MLIVFVYLYSGLLNLNSKKLDACMAMDRWKHVGMFLFEQETYLSA